MKGIGTDIVQIERIAEVYGKQSERFMHRILTDAEQRIFVARDYSVTFLANRFAAKEAVSKALGTGISGGIRFTDIEVLPGNQGEPKVNLYNKALERYQAIQGSGIWISLSDEADYAVAFVLIQ